MLQHPNPRMGQSLLRSTTTWRTISNLYKNKKRVLVSSDYPVGSRNLIGHYGSRTGQPVDYCCYPVNCHFGLVRSDPVPVPIVFLFLFLSPQLLQQLSEEVMQLFLF